MLQKLTVSAPVAVTTVEPSSLRQEIIQDDCLKILPSLKSDSAQIILADPP